MADEDKKLRDYVKKNDQPLTTDDRGPGQANEKPTTDQGKDGEPSPRKR